jgi:tetratricopeptide (TPR) repeat protein
LFFKAYKDYFIDKFDSSQKYLRFALFLNPTNQTFYAYQAANGIFLNESYPLLQSRINRVVKLQPQDSKSYLTIAKLYFLLYDKTGNNSYLEQAIIQMDKCLKMDTLFAQRYYRAGFYLTEAGNLNEGLQYVKFGLSLNPKDLPGWLLLARIYQLQGRQEQTLSALEKAYKLKPEIDDIRLLWHFAKNNPKRFKELPIPSFIDIRNFD